MIFKMYINGAWREGSGGYKDVVRDRKSVV